MLNIAARHGYFCVFISIFALMKVSESEWKQAMTNLLNRRKAQGTDDNKAIDNVIRDYRLHLIKCGYGRSILDVGCGTQFLKRCIPDSIQYIGIDAFPAVGYESQTEAVAIESDEALRYEVDTVVAFAVLDGCLDFLKACDNMKRIAKKNIIILTGIGIDVNEYHTHRLEHHHFNTAFSDWRCTHREELQPKVWLINYER